MSRIDEMKSLRKENVDYMCNEIKHIITTFGKRDPGSKGERDAQKYMKGVLDEFSDKTVLEDFKLNPHAFMGWIPFTVTCMLLAIVAYFFVPIASIVLVVLGLIPLITQFLLYKTTFDPLFKEKTSCNVTAIKKPTGEVKRRIFFNGHADATWEWTINYRFGGKVFSGSFVSAFAGILYVLGVSIAKVCIVGGATCAIPAQELTTYLGYGMLAFLPVFILMYFFSNTKVIVDGANDNLTGCYIPISLMKAMKEKNIELENTEVGVIISGSEEAGLRGAKAWAKAHQGEYKDVPTFVVSYDTIYELNCLDINDKDINGIVKTDKDVCSLLKTASQNTGAGARFNTVTVGATDPAAFVQGGFKSACVTALDHSLKPYYHTRRDTYDLLNKECLGVVYDMSVEALKLFDEGKYDNCSVEPVKSTGVRSEFPKK